MDANDSRSPLPTAQEGLRAADLAIPTAQTESASYRLAFADLDFLLREELRPVRLQIELLKPELAFQEEAIDATIVVFGSARIPSPETGLISGHPPGPLPTADRSRHYEEARRFARIVAEAGIRDGQREFVIVTGGGPGVMEAANRGAYEAGAESIGLNIVLPFEQAPNPYITPRLSFQFHYFAIRKMHFLLRARAMVCFPGGYGTLDELFETLTLIQTGKMAPIPVLLFDAAWWRRIINFEGMVEEGVISPGDLDIFRYVETGEEAWSLIRQFYAEGSPRQHRSGISG